jgi:hypothetical protein
MIRRPKAISLRLANEHLIGKRKIAQDLKYSVKFLKRFKEDGGKASPVSSI